MKLSIISGVAVLALTAVVSSSVHAEQVFTATQSQINQYCERWAEQHQPAQDLVTWQHFQHQAHLGYTYWMQLADGQSLPDLIDEIYRDESYELVAHDRLRTKAAWMASMLATYPERFRKMSEQQMNAYWEEEFSK